MLKVKLFQLVGRVCIEFSVLSATAVREGLVS